MRMSVTSLLFSGAMLIASTAYSGTADFREDHLRQEGENIETDGKLQELDSCDNAEVLSYGKRENRNDYIKYKLDSPGLGSGIFFYSRGPKEMGVKIYMKGCLKINSRGQRQLIESTD